jgi:hypothetical protein
MVQKIKLNNMYYEVIDAKDKINVPDCWVSQAKGYPLYVATHLMPNSTKEEREKLEYSLISDYDLVCNKKKV